MGSVMRRLRNVTKRPIVPLPRLPRKGAETRPLVVRKADFKSGTITFADAGFFDTLFADVRAEMAALDAGARLVHLRALRDAHRDAVRDAMLEEAFRVTQRLTSQALSAEPLFRDASRYWFERQRAPITISWPSGITWGGAQ